MRLLSSWRLPQPLAGVHKQQGDREEQDREKEHEQIEHGGTCLRNGLI
jgi:hypothetical protein